MWDDKVVLALLPPLGSDVSQLGLHDIRKYSNWIFFFSLKHMCGKFSDVMETWWSSFENLNVSSLVSCIREESVHSWRQWKLGVFWENQEGSWECQHHNKTALEQQMEKSSGYNRCINLSQRRTAGFHILLVLTNTIFSPDEVLELYDVWILSEKLLELTFAAAWLLIPEMSCVWQSIAGTEFWQETAVFSVSAGFVYQAPLFWRGGDLWQ